MQPVIIIITTKFMIIIIIMANIVPFGGRQLWTSIRRRINPLFNVTPLDGPINVSYSTSTTQFIIILMKKMNI